jgi:FMN phosphatase YigB (HAD superfamily)
MLELSHVYPEIYYRLQPYIMMICDQLEKHYEDTEPNMEMTDHITDNIYNDIVDMYPDLLEYAHDYEKKYKNENDKSDILTVSPRIYRRGYRHRGILRDLIDILYLSEMDHRRRRRRRYY